MIAADGKRFGPLEKGRVYTLTGDMGFYWRLGGPLVEAAKGPGNNFTRAGNTVLIEPRCSGVYVHVACDPETVTVAEVSEETG